VVAVGEIAVGTTRGVAGARCRAAGTTTVVITWVATGTRVGAGTGDHSQRAGTVEEEAVDTKEVE